jgi:hypothetical protein
VPPGFMVPSHTTSITAAASASAPIYFDFAAPFGDPDLISQSPPFSTNPSGTFTSSFVQPGDWTITPFQQGPDGTHGVIPVSTTTTMTATTAAFDPAVTAPTGDLWLESVDPSATVNPYVVFPGQSITIAVTITPSAAAGTTVSGTLYICAASFLGADTAFDLLPGPLPEASDVAALPYSYTIR